MKFVSGVVLARLLTPADFGLIAMIMVFFAVAEVFINSGMGMAYIQKKEVNDTDADTVFYTNLGISVVVYIILYLGAPFIAGFYNQPQLVDLTRVMAFVVVINAFNIIQHAQIARDVNFKKLAKVNFFSALLSGSIGITSAYYGLGVWALVLRGMMDRIFVTTGFWMTSAYRPKRQFSKQSFKSMFSFGFWVLLTSIIRKIFDNIYILAIGKFFPAAQLGYYTKAKQFQKMLTSIIGAAIGSVSFPVLAKLQDDKKRLRSGMQKFIQHSMFYMFPLSVGFIIVAEPFVILLLTDKWAPMIPFLQLLCVAGIFYPLHAINVQSLTAQGYIRLSFKLEVIKNSLRLLNIVVTYRYGVMYIILGEVILSIIFLWLNTFYIKKYIGYGLIQQMKDIGLIILIGVFSAAVSYYLIRYIFTDLFLIFICSVVLFSILYLVLNFMFNKIMLQSNIQIIKETIYK